MHRQIFFCFCFLQNIDASSLHYGVVFTILKNAPLINIEFSKPQPRLDLSTKPLNINSKKDGCNYSSFFLKLKENVFTAKLISALWKEGHSSKLKEPEVSTSYTKLNCPFFFGILTNLQHSFFSRFFFFKTA